MAILFTGAAGFIGFNFVLDWFRQSEDVISFENNLINPLINVF